MMTKNFQKTVLVMMTLNMVEVMTTDRHTLMTVTTGVSGSGLLLETPWAASPIKCAASCLNHGSCAAYNVYVDEVTGENMCELRGLNNAPLVPQNETSNMYIYDQYFGMKYDSALGAWYSDTFETSATYNDAKAICQSRGLHLMTIRTPAEQTKMTQIRALKNSWLGLYRPAGGAQHDIRYVDNDEPIGAYDNFNRFEPSGSPTDCVITYWKQSFQWYDAPCDTKCIFVCQSMNP